VCNIVFSQSYGLADKLVINWRWCCYVVKLWNLIGQTPCPWTFHDLSTREQPAVVKFEHPLFIQYKLA